MMTEIIFLIHCVHLCIPRAWKQHTGTQKELNKYLLNERCVMMDICTKHYESTNWWEAFHPK